MSKENLRTHFPYNDFIVFFVNIVDEICEVEYNHSKFETCFYYFVQNNHWRLSFCMRTEQEQHVSE